MAIVFNAILAVISTLTSIATIGSFIVPLINQSIQYPGSKELEIKRRRRKILRIVSGLILITIAILITITTLIDQSTNTDSASTPYPDKRFAAQPDSIVWSPDGSQFATADIVSGSIKIWDVASGKASVTYQPPSTQVSSLAWSPDGKYIAADVNGTLSIFQIDAKMLQRVFALNTLTLSPGPDVIAWSPDGTQIATANDNAIRVWHIVDGRVQTGQTVLVYSHHTKPVISLCWSPDGRYIASASLDNTIQLWQPGKGNIPYRTIPVGPIKSYLLYSQTNIYLSNVAWSPDGQDIALENSDGVLSAWNLAGKKLFSLATKSVNLAFTIASIIAWSPDSQFIATSVYNINSDEGKIVLVDRQSGQATQSFSYDDPSFPQYALAWSPDQAYIAATSDTAFSDGTLIYPSDEDDSAVSQSQQDQSQQDQFEHSLWELLEGESVVIGSCLGIITLYKAFEKPRLYYIPKSNKQKIIFHVKNAFFYLPFLLLWIASIAFIIYKGNTIHPVIVAVLWGCSICEIGILPSIIQRNVQPLFLRWLNSFKVKPIIKAGDAYAKQKKYHQAIAQYDQALVLLPSCVPAYIGRGRAYLSLGESQWALDDINRALNLAPQRMDLYATRGDAYYNLKDYEQALEDYNKAIDIHVESAAKASQYFNRGLTYVRLKNVSQARIDFLKSAALNPASVNSAWVAVWTGLGKKQVDKETAEQLAIRLQEIADRKPQQYTARLCSAVSLALKGNVKSALKEVEQAIAQSPQHADAYFWKALLLAYYYQGKSHTDEVVEAIEQAMQKDLPPILLTPLYWLEKDTPTLFTQRIQPLLQKYLA